MDTAAPTITVERSPFPHAIIDGLWNEDDLYAVLGEFPSANAADWIRYNNPRELKKLHGTPALWGPRTVELYRGMEALGPRLSEAFGMPELIIRPTGGGYHQIEPGGALALHADFNRDEDGLYRRLNVLVYLNPDWTDDDGGQLELVAQDGSVTRIRPDFNRTVIFETSEWSIHGHPEPLPGPRSRRSFAAYFFSVEAPNEYTHDHSTLWYRPEN